MAQIRRRKGNRQEVRIPTPIVVFVLNDRLEGSVVDSSTRGLGALFPSDCGLTLNQSVRILYKHRRQMAKVVRVESTDDGDRVGLRFIG